MFAKPSINEIQDLARSIGAELDGEEAKLFQDLIVSALEVQDAFVQARLPELSLPLLFPARHPGHRPLPEEDPYNAWLWRCEIGGLDAGVLGGKTFSFKDHVAVAGIPLTFGSHALEGFIPDIDATVVTRILQHGGKVIGKNTLRGPFGGKTSSDGRTIGDYWRPRNPHSAKHATGGSSSGSAAAVAAGQVDVAIGGDQRGSIRIPSAACGVVGLKPTFSLVPHTGAAFGTDQSVDHLGPIARTVADVAATLEAIAGFDDFDPRQGRLVPERYSVLETLKDGVQGLRIGILEEGFIDPIDESVRDGVSAAILQLESLGAKVERVSVPEHLLISEPLESGIQPNAMLATRDIGPMGIGAKTYYPSSIMAAWSKLWEGQIGALQPRTLLDLMVGTFSRRNFHGVPYAKAHNVRPHFVRAYDRVLADVDVLAMPTNRALASKVKPAPQDRATALRENLGKASSSGVASFNTSPFDYTGHPALAVPCGMSRGLPISMQLVGRFFEDATLLRVAHALHDAIDWTFHLEHDPSET